MKVVVLSILLLALCSSARAQTQSLEERVEAARVSLSNKLTEMRGCTFEPSVDNELVSWLMEVKDALVYDVNVSQYIFTDQSLPVCGMTEQRIGAPVKFSRSACAASMTSMVQAEKTLTKLTALHFGRRSDADQIANAIVEAQGSCASERIQLAVGGLFSCLLYKGEVQCWGYNEQGQTEIPQLHNPVEIAVGHTHACARDALGVHCWGHTGYGQGDVPGLWDVNAISSGQSASCALHADGAKCWGFEEWRFNDAPEFTSPTKIVNGARHACVMDQGTVKCWGETHNREDQVPALQNPTDIRVITGTSCALDGGAIKCWGRFSDWEVPARADIHSFDIGGNTNSAFGCALFENRAACWGSNSDGQIRLPQLRNPFRIGAGFAHSCAVDDVGVKCWGSNSFGQTDVPNELKILR